MKYAARITRASGTVIADVTDAMVETYIPIAREDEDYAFAMLREDLMDGDATIEDVRPYI